jgi:hypothetical protein
MSFNLGAAPESGKGRLGRMRRVKPGQINPCARGYADVVVE